MTNPTNTLSVETLQLFSAAKLWARVKAPYFGRLLSALVPCVAPDAIKTMGVTMGLRLFINDAFARSLTVELFGAVLLHEAGHVIRRHAVRCEAQGFDPELFNIAGDLAINDDIRAMGVALPACVIFPELYGLPRGLTAEDYYERLAKQGGKPKPQPGGQGQGKGGDKGPAMPGDGDSCGSCSGHRAEGEPAPGEGDSPEGERPQVEVAAIAKATAEAVRQYAAKNAGKVPGGLLVWAEVSDAPSPAGWRDHTATLTLTRSDDWDDWTLRDGKWLSQSDFAEFVEAHLPNFIDPRGADVLEMAQEFRARKSVRFDSSQRVKSGQTKITWHEDIDAKVGKGSIDIPDILTLAMQVYERGETFGLTARLRYRINDGSLMLGFVLDRPRDVLMAAFDGIRQEISGMTGIDVWIGTPN
jgi:hypothetical protein